MQYTVIFHSCKNDNFQIKNCDILAHLSQRLIGELIGYLLMVGCPSVLRRPSFTMLKDLLLQNRWVDQSQILCGASFGRGNDILFVAS